MNRAQVMIIVLSAAQIAGIGCLAAGSMAAGVTVFAISHAAFLYGTLKPSSQLFGHIQRTHSETLISIDDGPDPRTTPQLLEALERHRIKAAFFLVGQRAAKYPELVRAIHDAGHTIGNHTFSHPAGRFWCIDPWSARREIARCDAAIHAITGEVPTLFRSPVGHSNPFVHLTAAAAGKTVMAWSARGFDGVSTPKEKVVAQIHASLTPGAIVVMHEAYDPQQRGYSPAEILQAIAPDSE
ncbi:MAG: polysaccharide deacetylase family protein [Verrucomicrobiae bacterium]|nr:polysaccharide deacetylase family protein [Verrucomicrobiae bacterium]